MKNIADDELKKASCEGGFGSYVSKTVPCKTENVAVLQDFSERIVENKVSRKCCSKSCIVIDEIFSNAVKFSRSPDFTLGLSIHGECLDMRMCYGGILFNVLDVSEPDTTLKAQDRPVGGLGLLMVKKMCSDVSYDTKDGMNIIEVKINIA
ncbi:MAG: ATP-binding protein [Fibrobacter sp.]|nr:ATP-binding protein [Fibrobacter sp.]